MGFDDNRRRLARFVVLIADADLSGDHDPDRLDAAMLPASCMICSTLNSKRGSRMFCVRSGTSWRVLRTHLWEHSPGDAITGAITKVGDAGVRTALHDAANALLTRATKFSTLKRWVMDVAKRRGMWRAKVARARKLATVLHRTWGDGTEFV